MDLCRSIAMEPIDVLVASLYVIGIYLFLFVAACCVLRVVLSPVIALLAWLVRPKESTPYDGEYRVYDVPKSCYSVLATWLLVTCPLASPWLFTDIMRIYIGDIVLAHQRPHFTGEPIPCMKEVCLPNVALCCLTCGLWGMCGCADYRTRTWLDNHMVSGDSQGGEYTKYFRAGPGCAVKLFAQLLNFLTLGLAYPWTETMLAANTVADIQVGPHTAQFTGTGFEMCTEVSMVNKILSCLTCCLWECCGCAAKRRRVWLDSKISPAGLTLVSDVRGYATMHHFV